MPFLCQAAKTQAVSSYQWASILKKLTSSGTTTLTIDELQNLYNDLPEVQATLDEKGGVGGLGLCGKMRTSVKNWLEKTDPDCWDQIGDSQHDYPFGMGPFGETFATNARCFLNSRTHGLLVDEGSDMKPLDGEAYISIDHTLPMTGLAQGLLAKRLRSTFEIQTAFVPIEKKRKYRLTGPDLETIINMVCLWAQIEPFLRTILPEPDVTDMRDKLTSGSSMDENLAPFLKDRPPKFALSLLPSQKRLAVQKREQHDQLVCIEVEQQRLEVRDARMKFFEGALSRDVDKLMSLKELPDKLAAALHRKSMIALKQQSGLGAQAVSGYARKHMRVVRINNVQCLEAELVAYRKEIAPWFC